MLPNAVVDEVEQICRSFLWHGNEKSKRGSLVPWSMVCKEKSCGGLGVKPVHLWNQMAVMKNIWEMVQGKQSLWVVWVTKIKLRKMSFWGIAEITDSSWSWKNLLRIR